MQQEEKINITGRGRISKCLVILPYILLANTQPDYFYYLDIGKVAKFDNNDECSPNQQAIDGALEIVSIIFNV